MAHLFAKNWNQNKRKDKTMKKIKIITTGLLLGASIAVFAKPMVCDMTKCSKVAGGYICEKGACKEIKEK